MGETGHGGANGEWRESGELPGGWNREGTDRHQGEVVRGVVPPGHGERRARRLKRWGHEGVRILF